MRCVIPTMRSMSIKFFTATVVIIAVYLFLFFLVIEMWFISKRSPSTYSSLVLPYVVVHIDLKGAPPRLKYLESLLPMFKNHGANALMMEYEDMFPYEGKLGNFSARNAYGKIELKRFLKKAAESNFEIIPLIQTFGHMEHVLKLKEFRHLRETPVYPDSLCPSKIESRALIKHMLEQVINFHNAITPLKFIHVGCDEVFHINSCEQCVGKGFSNMDIFIEYVRFLSEYLREISPVTTVLIWDDMLRTVNPAWRKVFFLKNIEPVYWDYDSNLSVSHLNLLNYHKKFSNIWIASAYKGADGRIATIPNMKDRFLNHYSWLNFILNYKFGGESKIYNFRGIILTGWSRYSHMDPPCELLPVAIPSLVLNLLLVKKFKTGIVAYDETMIEVDDFFDKYILSDFIKSIKCHKEYKIDNLEVLNCDFESNQLYKILVQYELIKADIASGFNSDKTALSSIEYYASKKYINMNNLMEHINWCNNTLNELVNVEILMNHFMKLYYEKEVIDEYVNFMTYSRKKVLKSVLKELKGYMPTRVWERKPFNANMSSLLV